MAAPENTIDINFSGVRSPETYFGAARNEYFGNGIQGALGTQTLTIPAHTSANVLYLGGAWNFSEEYASNTAASAKIQFTYSSKNVYLVGAADTPVKIRVLRDGQPLPAAERGADVDANGEATIQAQRLYKLIEGADYSQHTIEIEVENSGLQAYTFTFG
jgi:hypothetical protein